MGYIESSKLTIHRLICSCAACGTKNLVLVREETGINSSGYSIEHKGHCKKSYHYAEERTKINAAVKAWNDMNEEYQHGFDLIWFEVDRVYETRWDCKPMPEGVRRAA